MIFAATLDTFTLLAAHFPDKIFTFLQEIHPPQDKNYTAGQESYHTMLMFL